MIAQGPICVETWPAQQYIFDSSHVKGRTNIVAPVTCTTGDAAVKEVKLEQASESDSSKPYRLHIVTWVSPRTGQNNGSCTICTAMDEVAPEYILVHPIAPHDTSTHIFC